MPEKSGKDGADHWDFVSSCSLSEPILSLEVSRSGIITGGILIIKE